MNTGAGGAPTWCLAPFCQANTRSEQPDNILDVVVFNMQPSERTLLSCVSNNNKIWAHEVAPWSLKASRRRKVVRRCRASNRIPKNSSTKELRDKQRDPTLLHIYNQDLGEVEIKLSKLTRRFFSSETRVIDGIKTCVKADQEELKVEKRRRRTETLRCYWRIQCDERELRKSKMTRKLDLCQVVM